MAWRARILTNTDADTALRSVVTVGFYETTDPANTPVPTVYLHSRSYVTEELTTIPAFQATIIAEGQAARTAYVRALAVKTALPVGQEIAIP